MARKRAISTDLRALAIVLAGGYLRLAQKARHAGEYSTEEDLDLSPETSPPVSRLVNTREAK